MIPQRMDMAWIRANLDKQTGLNDLTFADWLIARVAPDAKRHCTGERRPNVFTWSARVRQNEMHGTHPWSNLATVLYGWGQLWGEDYTLAVLYCCQRAEWRDAYAPRKPASPHVAVAA
jgi:hypothetical protein